MDPVHLIWTKCIMDILLSPRNKLADFFWQSSRWRRQPLRKITKATLTQKLQFRDQIFCRIVFKGKECNGTIILQSSADRLHFFYNEDNIFCH